MLNMITGLITIIDIILFIISISLFIKDNTKSKKYITTIGEIIDIKKRTGYTVDNDIYTVLSPTIKYNVNNHDYYFNGFYANKNMQVGEKLEILYDKNNPENACVKKGMFIAPIITGGIAILFLIALIILCILN